MRLHCSTTEILLNFVRCSMFVKKSFFSQMRAHLLEYAVVCVCLSFATVFSLTLTINILLELAYHRKLYLKNNEKCLQAQSEWLKSIVAVPTFVKIFSVNCENLWKFVKVCKNSWEKFCKFLWIFTSFLNFHKLWRLKNKLHENGNCYVFLYVI